ncbi:MAG: lactate racemase domain-containing protein [Candidatus Aureabacteria bacterium]|nr:lactate racemase domain-containing protein [Candidatus Auribacterota bacterium]
MNRTQAILHYGDRVLEDFLPRGIIERGLFHPILEPTPLPPISDPARALEKALEQPVGAAPSLPELLRRKALTRGITLLVDDYTRPNAHTRLLLPILLRLLPEKYAVPAHRINILIATGTHRPAGEAELRKILGPDLRGGMPVFWHDCDRDNITAGRIGQHRIGIDRRAFSADLLIALTDIDNHYFAGVAGGPKMLSPGIADRSTIEFEHLQMFGELGFAPNVGLGILDGNPVYECKKKTVSALLDALKKNNTDVYCLAAITDPRNNLVYLKGGEIFSVHRDAAEALKGVWTATLEQKVDIAIAGAAHLGLNVYHAGKGIHAASHAVRDGGWILAAAPCEGGIGDDEYITLLRLARPILLRHKDKMKGIEDALKAVCDAVRKDFRIGKQKAVDLFTILGTIGWKHLHMVCNDVSEEEKSLLPIEFWGHEDEPPEKRIRDWLTRYAKDKTITVVDNPGFLICVA